MNLFSLSMQLSVALAAVLLSACNTVPVQQRFVEQENLKAAQQGSPFRLEYKAMPGGSSIIRRYVIDPIDNPERWEGIFDTRSWELGSHAKIEDQSLREYVLKGQAIGSWSELVSSGWTYAKGISVQQLHEKLVENLGKGCDSFESTTIKKSTDDIVFEWKKDACGTWPAQHEIRRIKSVDGHLAILSYAIKTKKIDEAKRNDWIKRISTAVIRQLESGALTSKPDLSWLENRSTYYNDVIEKYGYTADEVLTSEGTKLTYEYPDQDNAGCRRCGKVTFVFSGKNSVGRPLAAVSVADASLDELFNRGCKLLVERRLAEAKPLIKEAALAHHSDAQHTLGLMYINGDGVESNYAEAYKWFQRAAAAGHARAQYDLGAMYRNGEGVQENKDAAKALYTLSANKGYALAAHELARIYQSEGDKENAEKWFQFARLNGYGTGD